LSFKPKSFRITGMEKAETEPAEQEHRDFLLEAAEKVSTWIIDEEIMKHFQKQAKAFYEDILKWVDDNEKTPDPRDLLVLPYSTTLDAHIGRLIDDEKPKHLSKRVEIEKSLRADYVLLTIIHDKRLKNPRTPLITEGIWPNNEEWVESKWSEITKGYYCGSRDIQTHIELSLKRVEADLWPEKPAKTKQNPTKRGRLKPILYTISGLVVFLAALLTIFHLLGWLEPIRAFISNIVSHN